MNRRSPLPFHRLEHIAVDGKEEFPVHAARDRAGKGESIKGCVPFIVGRARNKG